MISRWLILRVHNKGREESVEPVIRVYNNSSESYVTSCLAHVTMPNAKNSKFSLTMKKGDTYCYF